MLKTLFIAAGLAVSGLSAVIPNAEGEVEEFQLDKRVTTCPNYQQMVLDNHNQHRANHSANALYYNNTVAAHAQQWASQCNWQHNTQYGEGQNLAVYPTAREGIAAWYNSEEQAYNGQYGKASPDLNSFGSYGHFTQMVWKGTTSVGCATQFCSSMKNLPGFTNTYYTVCNYYPPGNYLGSFNTNVGQPRGAAVQGPVC